MKQKKPIMEDKCSWTVFSKFRDVFLQVAEATDVYLMMGKEHRISRNARALWYFSHLNSSIPLPSVESEDVSFRISRSLLSPKRIYVWSVVIEGFIILDTKHG